MNNDTIYDEACIYKLYLDGVEKVYIGHHKNLLVQQRLYGHRSHAKRDSHCQSKHLFQQTSNPKDVKIEIVKTFQNITRGQLKDKEREQIILHGYYEGKVWNVRLPSSLSTAELNRKTYFDKRKDPAYRKADDERARKWRKTDKGKALIERERKKQADKRKDPAYRKEENEKKKEWKKTKKGKAEYARRQAKQLLKAEQKRLADFQAIPDDDMNWFETISKHALTIYPRTKAEMANNRRRIKKMWNVKNRELLNSRRRKPKLL